MKILFLHNYYQQRGGEDLVVEQEMELAAKMGHEVWLYAVRNDDITGLIDKAQALISLFFNIRQYLKIKRHIRETNPDLVHCHNLFPLLGPAAIFAAVSERVPVIITLHNYRLLCPSGSLFLDGRIFLDFISGRVLKGIWKKPYRNSLTASAAITLANTFHRLIGTYRRCASIITLTNFQTEIISSVLHLNCTRKYNFMLDHPIKRSGDTAGNNAFKRRPHDQLTILFVGRLSVEKGILELMHKWPSRGEYQLVIAGGGPLNEEVNSLAAKKNNIDFLGRVEPNEVLDLMLAVDAVIVPSLWYEGCPMVVLEAYRASVPVLANDIGSLRELVIPGETGYLFEMQTDNSISAVLQQLRSADKDALKQGCFRKYINEFSESAGEQMLRKVYLGAVSSDGDAV